MKVEWCDGDLDLMRHRVVLDADFGFFDRHGCDLVAPGSRCGRRGGRRGSTRRGGPTAPASVHAARRGVAFARRRDFLSSMALLAPSRRGACALERDGGGFASGVAVPRISEARFNWPLRSRRTNRCNPSERTSVTVAWRVARSTCPIDALSLFHPIGFSLCCGARNSNLSSEMLAGAACTLNRPVAKTVWTLACAVSLPDATVAARNGCANPCSAGMIDRGERDVRCRLRMGEIERSLHRDRAATTKRRAQIKGSRRFLTDGAQVLESDVQIAQRERRRRRDAVIGDLHRGVGQRQLFERYVGGRGRLGRRRRLRRLRRRGRSARG